MKTVTIRGLPDETHALLKKRAQSNRRSLNQEVIAELSRVEGLRKKDDRVARLIAGAQQVGRGVKLPLSGKEIVEAIHEGRRR
jgi:plasmid stability protein